MIKINHAISIKRIVMVLALGCLGLVGLTAKKANPVTTVKSVDINRYLGKWFQIAYYPNSFQPKDCGLTVAEYSLDRKGDIVVKNTCYEDSEGRKIKKRATGKAWSVSKSNSRLKVRFFWPFSGDYWIVRLEENYQWVVVSDPARKYLWILARSAYMDSATWNEITNWLKTNSWQPSQLQITAKIK